MNTPDETPLELSTNNLLGLIVPDGYALVSKKWLLEIEEQAARYRSLGGRPIEGKLEGKLHD